MENILICITGPTASGKTALSIELALARHTEIISADSMQIYQGMDIGTAKPSVEERRGVCHHMLDICSPTENFSVARYVEMADKCAQNLLSAGKIPIVVGGTGLYLDALIECNVFSGNETDHSIRRRYEHMAAEEGNHAVYNELKKIDPEGAEKIHPNNLKRVIRALEVYEQTGMTLSKLNAQNRRAKPKYRAIKIGLCPSSREILYNRIDFRVDQMMQDGLLQEVQSLYRQDCLGQTASQAIGYKEFIPWLEGRETVDACVAALKQHSRNYAKRQLTWLKRDPSIHWLFYDDAEQFAGLLQISTEILQQESV